MNLDETQPLPRPESAVFSRYRLKAELGRGGMGVVWRAEDTKLQRDVALKFLPELVVRDREAMADLAAETRRCLELTHPHIVRVYDLVEENGRAAISMELVDGASLAERKLQQLDRCFSPAALAPWVAQLCAALDYAHAKVHIVHRDLKPLNLLVNAPGDLKVVDFGIARSLLNSGTRLSTDTRAASVSLGYVGPQQLLGEPASVADDIYSLGATLYELLTGRPPFHEGDIITQLREVVPPAMAVRRAEFGIASRETIPVAWEETVAACLAKKAADRPRTAGEVAARLGLESGTHSRSTGNAGTAGTGPPPRAQQSRRRRAAYVLAALAAILGVSLFWLRDPVHPADAPSGAQPAPAGAGGVVTSAVPIPPAMPGPKFVVTVEPPDAGARVWLGKEADKSVPDDGRLALAAPADGEHELTVQASGYQTYTTRVNVANHEGTASVKLVPVHGPVQVVARPGTVVTSIDGRGRERPVGIVPAGGTLRVDNVVTVGTYIFKLAHPDCLDAQQAATPVATARVARVAPPQTSRPGELLVFSVPDGADVLVNGTKTGVTPATLANLPSEKPLQVEVFLPGYRREKRTITLKPGDSQSLNIGTLAAASGVILLRLGGDDFKLPNATVRVDGQPLPHRNGRLDGLDAGPRVVEIFHPSYEPWKQTIAVTDRGPVTAPVVLKPRPGELIFAVSGPPAFTVEANGKPLGVKNNRASLPAGESVGVEIAAKGFKTDRRTVTLTPNGKQTLTVAMEKVALPEAGQPWTVPDTGLVLLPLSAGSFAMGSKSGEPTERPITLVTFKKPFWLGKTEVTQRAWTAVMAGNPSRFKADELPVENVSWTDAMEFCRLLTEREKTADRLPAGYGYTLPTEAQWEYACRAGTTEDSPPEVGETSWHEVISGGVTHAVAQKRANAWGFHDMHGNVWEWCADWYADKLKGGSVFDPKGNPSGTTRVRRGGSYVLKPEFFRFALRGKAEPDFRTYNVGFRLALTPVP